MNDRLYRLVEYYKKSRHCPTMVARTLYDEDEDVLLRGNVLVWRHVGLFKIERDESGNFKVEKID